MAHRNEERRDVAYDVYDGFMHKFAGAANEVILCKNIVRLLQKVREVFMINPVNPTTFELLDETAVLTEQVFRGQDCPEAFDAYYQLGRMLILMGEEDLGIACQFLHHAYRNRAAMNLPAAKLWYSGRGGELLNLLPIFETSFDDWEADTARESIRLPV